MLKEDEEVITATKPFQRGPGADHTTNAVDTAVITATKPVERWKGADLTTKAVDTAKLVER